MSVKKLALRKDTLVALSAQATNLIEGGISGDRCEPTIQMTCLTRDGRTCGSMNTSIESCKNKTIETCQQCF